MAFKRHFRSVARFDLGPPGAPIETATCSLSFHYPPTQAVGVTLQDNELDDIANQDFDDWAAWVNNANHAVPSSVTLSEVRVYDVWPDGRSRGHIGRSTRTRVTGSATQHMPFQLSVVVTLIGSERGDGFLGRFYLPPQAIPPLQQDGTMTAAMAGLQADGVATLLQGLSDKPNLDVGYQLCVASSKGEGRNNTVEEFRLGRVVDTQRRRRRKVKEGMIVRTIST